MPIQKLKQKAEELRSLPSSFNPPLQIKVMKAQIMLTFRQLSQLSLHVHHTGLTFKTAKVQLTV